MKVLFIDDEREPTDYDVVDSFPDGAVFEVHRTLHSVTELINSGYIPDIISFDFHMYKTDELRNGADYASYIAFLLDLKNQQMPTVYVHSNDSRAPDKIEEAVRNIYPDFKVDKVTNQNLKNRFSI